MDIVPFLHTPHFKNLLDHTRLEFFEKMIASHVKDKVVLDLNLGCGLFSSMAIKSGAKKVFSICNEPSLLALSREFLNEYVEDGRVTLIQANLKDISLNIFHEYEPDILIHDYFGADGFNENLEIIKTNEILSKITTILPDSFELWGIPQHQSGEIAFPLLTSFEEFPLEKLNIFSQSHLQNIYPNQFPLTKWEDAGVAQKLIESSIRDTKPNEFEIIWTNPTPCTHLRFWIKIKDTKSKLSLDCREGTAGNLIVSLPPSISMSKKFKTLLKLSGSRMVLKDVKPI